MGLWSSNAILILLAAQVSLGSVAGQVNDRDSGTPLASAVVSLADLHRSVVTDGEGRYRLANVPPGARRVAVRRLGYESRAFEALVPDQGTLMIDIGLDRKPIPLAPVDVGTGIALRGLDASDGPRFPDRGLSLAQVRNHPLVSELDVLEALGGGEVVLHAESPSGIHVRGGASDQIAYLLDGIPILNPYHAPATFSAWNPDALSRLDLVSSSPSPAFPDMLSGTVSGTTRAPGSRFESQGGFSTSQSRFTIDGPLGSSGAGYLMSVRNVFPGLLGGKRETAYLHGESGDWLGKVDAPLMGGHLGLLGYGSATELATAGADAVQANGSNTGGRRNELAWESTSWGGGWTLPVREASFQIRAWSVAGDARATWFGIDSLPPERLEARRRDEGLVAMVSGSRATNRWSAGVRAQRSRTLYRIRSDSATVSGLELNARMPAVAAFVQHQRPIARSAGLDVSLVSALAGGALRLDPAVRLEWNPTDRTTVSFHYARHHQDSQSLRNPESVVATIFPADLYVGADGDRVPVARSDLGIVAIDVRPTSGLRLSAQGYARSLGSLLLVAPHDSNPFATTGFTRGSGQVCGGALQLSHRGRRYGLVADYGLERVRLGDGVTSYVPDHGVAHSMDAGVVVFPTPSSSVRLGVTGLLGRHGTAVWGPFEWEASNLFDQGSEFAGSPSRSGGLGELRLPSYWRVDLGARKSWRVDWRGQRLQMATFAAATNLLARKNVLTVAIDPKTGERRIVEMRPRSPLVVGIDWSF